jgi:hypothetical protein
MLFNRKKILFILKRLIQEPQRMNAEWLRSKLSFCGLYNQNNGEKGICDVTRWQRHLHTIIFHICCGGLVRLLSVK